MNQVRGVLMIVLSGFAFYKGWVYRTGQPAMLAFAVGALALAVGIWRLTRKPPVPRP